MKKLLFLLTVIAMLSFAIAPVFAIATIRVDPQSPSTVSTPAHFNVYLTEDTTDTGVDAHIFLVMTEESWTALSGPVTVTWPDEGGTGGSATIPKNGDGLTGFTLATGADIPPGCHTGSDYTVSSLKDHLGTTGNIYWAFVAFLGSGPNNPIGGTISTTWTPFVVTVPSSAPCVLVYALARTSSSPTELFTNKIPPTNPGFVVPELATVLLVFASFSALAIYGLKRKR